MNINVLYKERFRPQYHFSAPHGFINDPNGLIYYRGEYHLFYQYNPNDICWHAPHWGHAVSSDLIHWKHLPVALYPDELGSIFSGTVVADEDNTSGLFDGNGGLVAIFTHDLYTDERQEEYQSIAYSSDNGRTWTKYSGNPVLVGKGGAEWKDFRDPKVFRYKDSWRMVVGGGRYRFYSSDDLIHWHQTGDMAVFEEFPDLFRIGDCWVLNLNGYGYYIGEYTGEKFIPGQPLQNIDFGNSWQACYTFSDMPEQRVAWMAWMRDACKGPTYPWRGNMSIPRELGIEKTKTGYRLLQKPVSELNNLRRLLFEANDISASECDLSSVRGTCLDIEIEADCTSEGFAFRCFENENNFLEIGYRTDEKMIYVDTRAASDKAYDKHKTMFGCYLSINGNQTTILGRIHTYYYECPNAVKLRILIDNSTAEVFVGDGEAVCTVNVYPEETANQLSISGSRSWIHSIKVYEMESIWKEE